MVKAPPRDRRGKKEDRSRPFHPQCPDHTFASWQSWISKNQHDLDEALRRYQDRLRRKKEKRRQRRREQDQDEDGVESRRESPVAGPSRAPPPPLQQKQEEERVNGQGKAKAAAALFAKSVIKAGSPRAAPALNSARDSDDSGSVRPRPSRVDKGKGRALSPRRQRPSPSPPRPADPAAALAAPVVAEEIFTEEDKHILVHQFARGRIKEWETDNICLFLARQVRLSPGSNPTASPFFLILSNGSMEPSCLADFSGVSCCLEYPAASPAHASELERVLASERV